MKLSSTPAVALAPFLSLALSLSLSACAESVQSNDVLTDGIYADLRAVATEDGTRVTATLLVGGAASNTYVQLTGDDTLTASADGETREMTSQNGGSDIFRYGTDLAASATDTEVVFRFERTIDEGAPDSRCTLPVAVAITSPQEGDAISRADSDLVITWEPSGEAEPLRLDIDGDCITDISETLDDDTGSYTVPAGTIESLRDPPEACRTIIRLSRERSGTLDPGFGEGGRVICSQQREISFRSDP